MADAISLSALALPVAVAFTMPEKSGLYLLAGLVGANAAVAGIKRLLGGSGIFGRPVGARGCGAFCDGGDVSGQPGCPSGHMTTVAMFVTVMWQWTSDLLVLTAGIAWAIMVAWSRWTKRCHSVFQIVGGTVFGIGCGLLFVRFLGPK